MCCIFYRITSFAELKIQDPTGDVDCCFAGWYMFLQQLYRKLSAAEIEAPVFSFHCVTDEWAS